MTHTYIKPSSNQRSTTPREASAAWQLRLTGITAEVDFGAMTLPVFWRDAVQGLRSSVVESNDLATVIETLGKELAAAERHQPELTLQVEGAPRDLDLA